MTFSITRLLPYLCDSGLHDRVARVRRRQRERGCTIPDAHLVVEALAAGADAICPFCFQDCRDLLLSLSVDDARRLLHDAARMVELRWLDEIVASAAPLSLLVERGVQAEKVWEALELDAALLPGARKQSAERIAAALKLQHPRLWLDDSESRAVLDLATTQRIAAAIQAATGRIEPTQVAHALRAAGRIGDGPWAEELFDEPDALRHMDEAREHQITNRFLDLHGHGLTGDPE